MDLRTNIPAQCFNWPFWWPSWGHKDFCWFSSSTTAGFLNASLLLVETGFSKISAALGSVNSDITAVLLGGLYCSLCRLNELFGSLMPSWLPAGFRCRSARFLPRSLGHRRHISQDCGSRLARSLYFYFMVVAAWCTFVETELPKAVHFNIVEPSKCSVNGDYYQEIRVESKELAWHWCCCGRLWLLTCCPGKLNS